MRSFYKAQRGSIAGRCSPVRPGAAFRLSGVRAKGRRYPARLQKPACAHSAHRREILLNVESASGLSLTSPGPDDAKPSRAAFARLGGSATAGWWLARESRRAGNSRPRVVGPNWISRSLCSAGIVRCIKPLAQSRNKTNSSWVNGADKSGFIFQICASGAAVQASILPQSNWPITGLSVWTFDQLECGNVGAFQPRL